MKTFHLSSSFFASTVLIGLVPLLAPVSAHGAANASARAGSARDTAQSAATAVRVHPAFVASTDPDAVYIDEPGDGAIWAVGATYKTRFDGAGALYIPFFGSSAPRSFPVALKLRSITAGGVSIAFDAHAAPQRAGDRVSFARGGVTEVYDLGARSIEQSFVVESLPVRDEVVVRVGVETELQRGSGPEGQRFANALGHVSYGRARVVDAAGRSRELESRLDGDVIAITLPAVFAREAALPLTIDPVISTFSVDTSAAQDYDPDIAYDAANDRWLVCFERVVNALDHDVWAQLHDSNGNLIASSGAYVDSTTLSWVRPRVANLATTHQFEIVASVHTQVVTQPATLWGRLRNSTSTLEGVQTQIDGGLSGSHVFAAVGGDPSTSGAHYFCVVWERSVSSTEADIDYRLVDGNGNVVGLGPVALSAAAGVLEQQPAISRSNDGSKWNIAWQREIISGTHDIYAATVNASGSLNHAPFAIATGTTDDTDPAVSSTIQLTGYWTCVFTRAIGAQHDIMGTLVQAATPLSTDDLSVLEGSTSSRDQILPDVDCDGAHFAVTYSELESGTNYDTYVSDLYTGDILFAPVHLGLAEGHRLLGTSTLPDTRSRIASKPEAGGSGKRALVVWDLNSADVQGAVYDHLTGGPRTVFCFGDGSGTACPCSAVGLIGRGCPNSVNASGASLGSAGNASTTEDTLQLFGDDMPPNSSCLYFQGTAQSAAGAGAVFGDGLQCVSGTIVRLAMKQNDALGSSMYPAPGDTSISVRGGVSAYGATRHYQIWYRNAASFCTSSTFNLTNGLTAVWTL